MKLTSIPIVIGLTCTSLGCGGGTNDVLGGGLTGGAPGGGSGGQKQIDDDDLLLGTGGQEGPSKECERQMRLAAVTTVAPEPFDVVVVADHSGSLSWSRDDFARGLANFLADVRGHDVRFFVLTPTQYGASSQESDSPLNGHPQVAWQDPVTELAHTFEMTTYSEVCETTTGQVVECPTYPEPIEQDLLLTGQWTLNLPEPVAAITSDMTAEEIAREGERISAGILSLGVGGSSDEQPICTLQRYLGQDPALLPDNVVFLLLTDEEDQSDPDRCLAKQEIRLRAIGERKLFELEGSGLRAQRLFQCTPVDDHGQVVGDPVKKLWNLGACSGAGTRTCSSAEEQQSQSECPLNHLVSDCTIDCKEQGFLACRVEETGAISDACNAPFELSGRSYENLLDYCEQTHPEVASWGTCIQYLKDGTAVQEIEQFPLLPTASLAESIQVFRQQADQRFGRDGYAVELVGFQPTFSCQPQAGQSELDVLLGLVDGPEDVFPICGDYSDALSRVEQFAGALVQTSYSLDLEDGDEPRGVRLVGASGESRELAPDQYSYDPVSGQLDLLPAVVLADDTGIEVDVLMACMVK